VKIKVAWVSKTCKTKEPAVQTLTDEYLQRIAHYAEIDGTPVRDEDAILALAGGGSGAKGKAGGKQRPVKSRHKLVLLDARGKQFSSEELAAFLEREQVQALPLLFAIGGSDGFTEAARQQAALILSLGKMTLPHELARVVVLEQIYRAFTILKKHPYHLGH
jgi:23S rRNA (pseudouridine1915-N3)-methyltransferase